MRVVRSTPAFESAVRLGRADSAMKYCVIHASADGGDSGESAADNEPWFVCEEVDGPSDMEVNLGKPEYYGSIHRPGVSAETAQAVVDRAKRYPGRLSVVSSLLPRIVREFIAGLPEENAELFVVLEEYENQGTQILAAMMQRAPFTFGGHILRFRIPDYAAYGGQDIYLQLSSVLRFVAMPFGGRTSVMFWRTKAEKNGFADFLRRHGFRSEAKIREALFCVAVCYWMQELEMAFPEAVRCAGGKSVSHTMKLVKKILLVESREDLKTLDIEEAVRRADGYMLLHPEKAERLPELALPPSLLTMRLRRSVQVAAAKAQAAALGRQAEYLDAKLADRLFDTWERLVRLRVGRYFARGAGREDAFVLVFEKAFHEWVEHQVLDEHTGAYWLDMPTERQGASLLTICRNVCQNEERKKHRREAPLTSIQEFADEDVLTRLRVSDPLQLLEAEETREIVEMVISKIPPAKRDIARLALIDGFTTDEIAEECGLSGGYVANVVSEARKLIATELGTNW
jgi:RNA polymerase sigma factor (sigma-70 family)